MNRARDDGRVRATRPLSYQRSTLSTSLFNDLWADALDPGYALAAAGAGGLAGDRPEPEHEAQRRSLLRGRVDAAALRTTVAVSLVGVVLGIGIRQIHASGPAGRQGRTALAGQVTQRQREVQVLAAAAIRLRQEVATARTERLALSADGNAVKQQLKSVEGAAAAVAVSGPGVTVTLTDAAPPAAEGNHLTDRDLQSVVNALWGAGAEAISVGGHRLGPQTAIRTAGQAVLVDFGPIASPYAVEVIGEANMLSAGLADSAAGRRLRTLHAVYGIGFKVAPTPLLVLGAVTPATPRSATALIPTGASPGAPPGTRVVP